MYIPKCIVATVLGLVVGFTPLEALAVTFKFDTMYKLSGEFHFGLFGKLHLDDSSFLFYDSTTKQLHVEANATGGHYRNASIDLDIELGGATPKHTSIQNNQVVLDRAHEKVSFQFMPLSMRKHGKTQVGFADIDNTGRRDGNYMMFSSMQPFIREYKNSLYLFSWVSLWGRGFDVHADPKFRLTEMPTQPPGEPVPEPFTLALLASGLGAGAWKRRSMA